MSCIRERDGRKEGVFPRLVNVGLIKAYAAIAWLRNNLVWIRSLQTNH
jgi:hypothetical protein